MLTLLIILKQNLKAGRVVIFVLNDQGNHKWLDTTEVDDSPGHKQLTAYLPSVYGNTHR